MAGLYLDRQQGLQWCQHHSEFQRMPCLIFFRLTEGGEHRTNQFNSSSVIRHDDKGQVKVRAAFYNIRIWSRSWILNTIKSRMIIYKWSEKKVVRALQGKIVDILCSFGLLAVFLISPNSIQSETLSFCCLKSGPRVALLLDLISLEVEALNGSLIKEVVARRVGCSPVQLTLVLPLRQEWIRPGDSAHCSEPWAARQSLYTFSRPKYDA